MPRIRDSQSNPLDFHRRCFPSLVQAHAMYGNVGDAPDGRGNVFVYDDDEHPPYEDADYTCEADGSPLTARDNGPLS